MSGGTEKATFFLSASDLSQIIVPNNALRQIVGARLSPDILKLTAGASDPIQHQLGGRAAVSGTQVYLSFYVVDFTWALIKLAA
jgi:hypothetical protein